MSNDAARSPLAITLKKWKKLRGNLIMILHELQNQHGFVPRNLAQEVGKELGIPLARIYEVLTFYNYFKLQSPGKYVVSVCTGTACHLKGASKIVDELRDHLGIEEGETTPDGEMHLQSVRCLGCCGLAPVVTVNEGVYGKLKLGNAKDIVDKTRESSEEVTS
ncbi:MAG: NAD(P)H-dependent oxidoreductase subunit E [Gemmataceae bacterium]